MTPGKAASPCKEQYGDRFIPSRAGSSWHTKFDSPTKKEDVSSSATKKEREGAETGEGTLYII